MHLANRIHVGDKTHNSMIEGVLKHLLCCIAGYKYNVMHLKMHLPQCHVTVITNLSFFLDKNILTPKAEA